MTYEDIEKFMRNKNGKELPVIINFKTRKAIRGLFIKMADYEELRRKNLWRIVSGPNIEPYQASQDPSLCRIFNGAEMTRLEVT